jgi:hypothetical protein
LAEAQQPAMCPQIASYDQLELAFHGGAGLRSLGYRSTEL